MRSSSDTNLDSIVNIFSNEGGSDYRELSRYILEDLIRCDSGTKFLLCLPVHYGDTVGIDLRHASKMQQKLNNGGEKCKISGKTSTG